MIKIFSKNKYLGLIIIAVIAFNFLFLPLNVFAQDASGQARSNPAVSSINPLDFFGNTLSWIGGEVVLFISSAISAILGVIFGIIISLEAKIIDYILNPTNFPLTSAPIVTLGWGITRDLANMFFILILLIISFATVLRIKSWAIQQLLWKVVVAALLINFSLVIAGFLIDFTQILTQFFLKQITGGGIGTITTKLAAAMQILNFYNPARPDNAFTGITQFGASGIAATAGIILTLVGLVITAFVFGAAMIFLILRILHLWLLLIFAPIVWMLWILPTTSSYFSKWWHDFIKWAFFAPIYVFMIYLSLSIFDKNGQLNTGVFPQGNSAWGTAAPGLTTVGMPAAIFQWILVIAMMFGSLIVAQGFSAKTAAASQKMLKGWGDKSKNWAGRQLRRGYVGATRPEAPAPPPAGAGLGQRFGYRFRQAGAAVGRGALAVPGFREQQMKYMGEEDKAYKAAYDKYKGLDPALLNQVAGGIIADPRAKLAIQQLQIEKDMLKPGGDETLKLLNTAKGYGQEAEFLKLIAGKLGKVGWKPTNGFTAPVIGELLNRAERDPSLEQGLLKQINEEMKKDLTAANGYDNAARTNLLQRSQKYGKEKDFLKFFPNLAPTIGKNIKETVAKIEKAADIYEDQLVANVVRELNPSQLKDIGKNGTDAKRRAAKIAVIQEYRNPSEFSLSDRRDIREVIMETNKRRKEQLRAALPEKLRKMSYQREITTTPAWEMNT